MTLEEIMKKENGGVPGLFLAILSGFYYLAVSARVSLYRAGLLKTKRLPVRVISVGNLTTGGVGKTPMVISIARTLGMGGKKVGVISRGYGRKDESALLVVSDGSRVLAGAEEAGDEPVLVADSVPRAAVVVCSDRYRAALHAVERLGCDVLILDDGYQRLDVHRDLNILLADASAPFGNSRLLPRGHLREPVSAIRRADTVVLTRTEATEGKIPPAVLGAISAWAPHATLWLSSHEPVAFVDGRGRHVPLEQMRGRFVYLFSGIASPGSFQLLVEGLGGKISGHKALKDHHFYSPDDLKNLDRLAMDSGAEVLVTTEKDWVKIKDMVSAVRLPLWVMRIELRVKDLTGHWLKLIWGHHG